MATATKQKMPTEDLEKIEASLKKAGISTSLDGYTDAQIQAAKDAPWSLKGEALRARIMGAGKPKKEAAKKRGSYSDEVKEAAKIVREVLEGKGAPGPKQIKATIAALDGADPVKASGVGPRKLADYAKGKWKPSRDERPAPLTALAARVSDPWATGRRLAAILHALSEVARKRGSVV